MPEKTRRTKALTAMIFTAITFLAFPMMIKASSANRKLEDDPIKCTPCLQNNPPPSPPPPSLACPPPPPPPPSPPKKSYCPPPPPSSSYIYMTGPPGELYPVDQQYGEASSKSFMVVKISILISFGVMGFLMNMN